MARRWIPGAAALSAVLAFAAVGSNALAGPELQKEPNAQAAPTNTCTTTTSGLLYCSPGSLCTIQAICPTSTEVYSGSCDGRSGDMLQDAYRASLSVYRCRWKTDGGGVREAKAVCCE